MAGKLIKSFPEVFVEERLLTTHLLCRLMLVSGMAAKHLWFALGGRMPILSKKQLKSE